MTETSETIDILLSTFNGEKYLREQLDGIIAQTYTNWKLVIRDDGSDDGTETILKEYCNNYPGKIILAEDGFGNLGYKNSFAKLMLISTADYILFSDQDDYWHPDKIQILLDEMRFKEKTEGNKPLLMCCDLAICDEKLNVLEPSYFHYIRFKQNQGQQSILLASQLHGCAFLFNRRLLQLCNKIIHPVNGLNDFLINGHDNFLSVVCALTGNIHYINKSLIKHRIHGANSWGFSETREKSILVQLKTLVKYVFNNKAYRDLAYSKKIKENKQVINAVMQLEGIKVPEIFKFFESIDGSGYFRRKYLNAVSPFVMHYSFMDKIVYIACF
ncbi:MAG: glycosyltransferase family 2 protein [Bacteroidia bacterium]|nr:glycosyltransferase family 2 protein [Bacteroidia bacterium]